MLTTGCRAGLHICSTEVPLRPHQQPCPPHSLRPLDCQQEERAEISLEGGCTPAMAQGPLPCLPLQHTGPGEKFGFQGRVERGGGSQRNAPALSLLWLELKANPPRQFQPPWESRGAGCLVTKSGGLPVDNSLPHSQPVPAGCFPGVFRIAGWWLPAGQRPRKAWKYGLLP